MDTLEKSMNALQLSAANNSTSVNGENAENDVSLKQPVSRGPGQVSKLENGLILKLFYEKCEIDVELKKDLKDETKTKVIFSHANGADNVTLNWHEVPAEIYKAIYLEKLNPFKLEEPLTVRNYAERIKYLLWLEEAHDKIEKHRFYMVCVKFEIYKDNLLRLDVEDLSEAYPSPGKGNKLYIWFTDKREPTRFKGHIEEVRERDIIFKCNPEVVINSLIGSNFDVAFPNFDTSFKRCHMALNCYKMEFFKHLLFPSAEPSGQIRKVDEEIRWHSKCLDEDQRRAVSNILQIKSRPAPYIIQGPPGTGKTAILIEAILQIYKLNKESRFLVCAKSNSCVDLLAEKLKISGMIPHDRILRLAARYRTENLIPQQIADMTQDQTSLQKSPNSNYRIIISTCMSSSALTRTKEYFNYVLIDDAGHVTEPLALIPISLVNRYSGLVVLAGDLHQLGPTVFSPIAGSNGLQVSILKRLSEREIYQSRLVGSVAEYDERYITQLKISYRSDPRIMEISNRLFYNNELKSVGETPKKWMELLEIDHPLVFLPVEGIDLRESQGPSWFNLEEAKTCFNYVKKLYQLGLTQKQIGIITPYEGQVSKLKELFENQELQQCKIGKLQSFQGDEREIIIISTVRSREEYIEFDQRFNLGLLRDQRRFNVAVSRARWLCIVAGCEAILKQDPCWAKFLESAHRVAQANAETKSAEELPKLGLAAVDCFDFCTQEFLSQE